MSAQTTVPPVPPFQQWQSFFPAGSPYGYDNDMMQQILATVSGSAEQTKQQAANDIARDILRTVERNGQLCSITVVNNSITRVDLNKFTHFCIVVVSCFVSKPGLWET
jgi:hypothetical protein